MAEKCFVETNNREQIFSRFLQNSKKNFPKFVWSVTNLSAKFLKKTPIFAPRTPCASYIKYYPDLLENRHPLVLIIEILVGKYGFWDFNFGISYIL